MFGSCGELFSSTFRGRVGWGVGGRKFEMRLAYAVAGVIEGGRAGGLVGCGGVRRRLKN